MATSRLDRDPIASGFPDVAAVEKQSLVDAVFNRVAQRYDLMNDRSAGGPRRLRRVAVLAGLAPPRRTRVGYRVLDLAGGTGDVALRIADRSPGAEILVADINAEMLSAGRRRTAAERPVRRIAFV